MIHVKTLIKAIPSNLMNQFQIIGYNIYSVVAS